MTDIASSHAAAQARGDVPANHASAMGSFRDDLAHAGLQPLWDIMRRLAPHSPTSGGTPILWRWERLRDLALRAGDLVSAEEAERRVLVLENPAFAGQGKATSSLYAGIQCIMPGETAPSHRHTASALRLIMDGTGGYTSVDGERADMHVGDFIITPSLTFHDHGNEGDAPVIWLDGLDVFLVNLMNAPFGEDYPEQRQPLTRPTGDALARYGSGLLPHGFEAGARGSGMFAWPYDRTRAALHAMLRGAAWDPASGLRLTYIDPATGRSPIRTLSAAMQLLPAGFRGETFRSTAGAVMSVVEGSGQIAIGGEVWTLRPKDVFIVPSWFAHRFEADEDLVLFGFSDEVLQRHLGFLREERGAPL